MKVACKKLNGQTPTMSHNVKTLVKKKGVDFKILQITDVHIGGGLLSVRKDKKALTAVRDLIEYSKPDFIVVTGDVSYPIPFSSGTINNMRSAKWFTTMMKEIGIPWAMVYGNHDCECFSTHKKSKLSFLYESIDNCVFSKGEELTGEGNYVVRLENEDGSLNNLLVFLDSNSYETKSFFSGFDIVHDDQLKWYEKEIKEHCKNGEPSMIFQHIPFREVRDIWWKLQEGDKDVKYYFGTVSEKDQYFGVPRLYGKEWETILKLGSTKGVFYGHDHLNTLSMSYKGVRLTYGMSIDYLAYAKISKVKNQRGATEIYVLDDGSFDLKLLSLTTVRNENRGGRLRFGNDDKKNN